MEACFHGRERRFGFGAGGLLPRTKRSVVVRSAPEAHGERLGRQAEIVQDQPDPVVVEAGFAEGDLHVGSKEDADFAGQ